MVAFQAKFEKRDILGYPPFIALGSIFLIMMGLLPALMLRQGVTQGRPARFHKKTDDQIVPIIHSIFRILVWVFSIGSQAIMCVLFIILGSIVGGDQFQPEILFPCLAFTLAAVVSLVSCYGIQLLEGCLGRS